ncbi:unnamed protein product [Brachionus calyciflorus]|uniref:EF-hand domain-containing protein n=1 Tax=Brachionus calyciflorus TaxID=104777 RepID=A0A813NUA0_9BILA|nr:unnamed protein product [Brachionus calyciflorus]
MQRSTTTISGAKQRHHKSLTGLNRASSAQGNLQSHPCFQSSLYNDKERAAGSLKAWKERNQHLDKHKDQENQDGVRLEVKRDYELENIILTQSIKQSRRLTLGNTQNISDWEITLLKRQKSYAVAALGELKGKLEEKINLNALHDLNLAFLEADADGSGTLELEEFKEVVKNALKIQGRNDEEIAALFMKINFSSDGKITWDEFCTFMQLNFSEKEEILKRKKEVVFNLPARSENNPHRTPVQRISCTSDLNYMVMSADGITSFWSPTGELKRVKKEIIEKRVVSKDKGDKQETKRQRPRWITDFLILNEFNKIVIGTGDRELQFWELSSFEPYCQISSLHTVPIKLAYCYNDKDDVTITYGDTDGCVNILIFNSIGETLRLWKTSPAIAQMPTIYLDKVLETPSVKYVRWKAHNDWVEQIRIDKRLNQIISCSNDENYALIIGCILPSTDVNSHLQAVHSASQNSHYIDTLNQSQQLGSANTNITPLNTHNPSIISHTSIENNPKRQNMANHRVMTPSQQAKFNNTISQSSRDVKRRPDTNETIFKVYKGVKTFDFSFEKNLIITGGK